MASCAYCNTTILFGGATSGNLRFCNATCQSKGRVIALATRVSDADARNLAIRLHAGPCPKCGGSGPVDVHTSYRVWSALFMTQWQSLPQVSCRPCGVKAHLGGLGFSAVLGWWGFPWGLILTPVQIGRNVAALISAPDTAEPSAKLVQAARLELASRSVGSSAPITP